LSVNVSAYLQRSAVRWWVVGILFVGVGTGILHVLVAILGMPLVWGSLLGAEIGTLLRFVINDRWVFGFRKPSWARLWKYHVANGSGFVIWFGVTNLLSWCGIHYLLASVFGMACSVGWGMLTNFLWVWRQKETVDL